MNLSNNLTLREVCKSQTASRLGINNKPDEEFIIENLRAVAREVFQPCRDHIGGPLYVSSGYRSRALNDAIGGSKTSQHISGMALDLDADVFGGKTNAVFNYIRAVLLISLFGSLVTTRILTGSSATTAGVIIVGAACVLYDEKDRLNIK